MMDGKQVVEWDEEAGKFKFLEGEIVPDFQEAFVSGAAHPC